MFKAIVSAETLTSALDSVSVLVDECKIHLEEDGLEIRAVDPRTSGWSTSRSTRPRSNPTRPTAG